MGTNSFYGKASTSDTKTDITHGKVKQSVESIDKSSKNMQSLFSDFRSSMGEVYQEDNFSGEAGDTLQERFDELQNKFDKYTDAVQRFAAVVEGARQATEDTEKELQNKADALGH